MYIIRTNYKILGLVLSEEKFQPIRTNIAHGPCLLSDQDDIQCTHPGIINLIVLIHVPVC